MVRHMRNGKQISSKEFFELFEKDQLAEIWYYPYKLSTELTVQLSKGTEVKCNDNYYQIIKDKGDDINEI